MWSKTALAPKQGWATLGFLVENLMLMPWASVCAEIVWYLWGTCSHWHRLSLKPFCCWNNNVLVDPSVPQHTKGNHWGKERAKAEWGNKDRQQITQQHSPVGILSTGPRLSPCSSPDPGRSSTRGTVISRRRQRKYLTARSSRMSGQDVKNRAIKWIAGNGCFK